MSLHDYSDGEYDVGGTKNYQVWSCAMLLALEGKNKTGFIDGSCRRSAYAIISSEESHRFASGNIFESSQTSAFSATVPNRGNFQRSQVSNNFQRPSSNVRPNDNGSRRTAGGFEESCNLLHTHKRKLETGTYTSIFKCPALKLLAIKRWDEHGFVIRPCLVGVTCESVRIDL
uniref:Retrotransposon Copia-like N-terminal domain-containing protein n=1 Tax=Tanacetum cinerariifolium TaxID=118510 RepID=A0A6L2LCP4_TANCI|nr:hypothetical protein [Tanacetum cinerariifolium]